MRIGAAGFLRRLRSGVADELLRQRLVPCRTSVSCHQRFAKVSLRRQAIVSRAAERQIRSSVRTSPGKRLEVMDLQVARFAATLPASVDESAAPRISFVDVTPQRRWDVPAPSSRTCTVCLL
jgi:hypothetical protein